MNKEGIGMGLTIVKQIVEQADGAISVSSDGPGHGSLFKFTMRMHSEQNNFEQAPHLQRHSASTKNYLDKASHP